MPWTPAERERILAIAELLTQAPTANHVILSAFDWQPVGGSQLESDLNNVESGPGGLWGSAPLERARLHAQFWLVLGTVDVHSTGVLMRADVDQLPAPWPNARAALEKFAGACWLLDPALTVRQRAARAAAIEVEDRRQTRNAAAYAVGADPGSHDSPEADAYDEFVHTELPALFHSVTTGGGVTVEGERLPGYTDLVEGFVDRHLLGGRGREAYSVLSSRTHPSVTAILALIETVGGGVRLRESSDNLAKLGQLCAAAHYTTLAQVLEWFGVSPSEDALQFWEEQINAVLPGTIRDRPASETG